MCTASDVTSGPMPSPGRIAIDACMACWPLSVGVSVLVRVNLHRSVQQVAQLIDAKRETSLRERVERERERTLVRERDRLCVEVDGKLDARLTREPIHDHLVIGSRERDREQSVFQCVFAED